MHWAEQQLLKTWQWTFPQWLQLNIFILYRFLEAAHKNQYVKTYWKRAWDTTSRSKFACLNVAPEVFVVRWKRWIGHLWPVNVELHSVGVSLSCSVSSSAHSLFCTSLFLTVSSKSTQRTLSTHLKVWVPISFTQFKWCSDEHANKHSPHAAPLAFTLCSGSWYLWVGRWWKSSSPLSYTDSLLNTVTLTNTPFLLRSAIKAIAPAILTRTAMLPWRPSSRCLSLLDSTVTSHRSWQQTRPALITNNMEAVG